MTNKKLFESHAKGRGSRILLISEGQGSSGHYSADMLKRDGHLAFPAGSKIYYNHLGEQESWERNGSRDVRDLIGVTTTDAAWSEDDRGLTASAEFFSHARDFVESVLPHVGLSVEASGVVSEDGVVESLVYSPLNAVALVPVAGRGGKVQGLFEGFREKYDSISDDESPTGKEDPGMTPEEIKNAVMEAFAEFGPTLTTALTEALKPVEVAPEDEDKNEDVAVVAEALVESKLPASARTKVLEAVKTGTPVADAIATEKSYIESVLAESKTEDEGVEGRIHESGTGTGRSVKAWG